MEVNYELMKNIISDFSCYFCLSAMAVATALRSFHRSTITFQ